MDHFGWKRQVIDPAAAEQPHISALQHAFVSRGSELRDVWTVTVKFDLASLRASSRALFYLVLTYAAI